MNERRRSHLRIPPNTAALPGLCTEPGCLDAWLSEIAQNVRLCREHFAELEQARSMLWHRVMEKAA